MTMRWICAGAFVDFGDLRVAEEALYRVLLDVAIAAVDLDCAQALFMASLGGEELCHAGLFA